MGHLNVIEMFDDPINIFWGVVLITVPHMDDEVLACGGMIARLPDKKQVHFVYATDGLRSPAPVVPHIDTISPDLSLVRMNESKEALRILGVPSENAHFLSLPDGRLRYYSEEFTQSLIKFIKEINPDHVLIPFRYDRHPDHLAVNRLTRAALRQVDSKAQLIEYFVYYRSQLLPGRDIRKYIHRDHLINISIEGVSDQKRRALNCFKSQITRFYTWQNHPVLSKDVLDEVCQNPELFLRFDPLFPGVAIFTNAKNWIRFTHLVEPSLKKGKDRILALLHRFY